MSHIAPLSHPVEARALEIHSLKACVGGTKVQRVRWAGEVQPERAGEKQIPFPCHHLGPLVLTRSPRARCRVCI